LIRFKNCRVLQNFCPEVPFQLGECLLFSARKQIFLERKVKMSVYEIVTEQIISQLQAGVVPWRKPWRTEMPCNLISGKPYRGINIFLLAMQGRASRYWMTYKQAAELGGHVRAGERASVVTFWNVGQEKLNKQTGKLSKPFLLRYYSVFNATQIDGIDQLKLGNASLPVPNIDACDALVAGMQNPPKYIDADAAWYRPSADTIGMPVKPRFNSAEGYYATLFHEMVHSTGHASRIGREGIEQLNSFGSESYSREELVAELGASMLCGITGISPAVLDNSASYLQSWISRLKGDSKLVLGAASAAQKAADYIRGQCEEKQ
jgi:antirestriction protein ArdC